MRSYGLFLAGSAFFSACGTKRDGPSGASNGTEYKASTPKEFWDSCRAAVRRKDAAALAKNMYCKAFAKHQADQFRKNLPGLRGKNDAEALVAFFELFVIEPDEEEFVRAEENGDRAAIVFNRKRGEITDSGMKQFLVKEDGRWWQGDRQ